MAEYIKAHLADKRTPDSCEERVERKGTSKSEVWAVNLALDLLANDTVLLGVHLVQDHPQQAGIVLAVALLANQLQAACSRMMRQLDRASQTSCRTHGYIKLKTCMFHDLFKAAGAQGQFSIDAGSI